jgi:hypothetical protein
MASLLSELWCTTTQQTHTLAHTTHISAACEANCTTLAEKACTASAECGGFFMWPVPLPSQKLLRTLGVGYVAANCTGTHPQVREPGALPPTHAAVLDLARCDLH